MYSVSNKPDMIAVLSTLAARLQQESTTADRFLQQMEGQRVIDPFQYPGNSHTGDPIPEQLWKASGIRRLVLDPARFLPVPASLPNFVSNSSIIEFDDWAAVDSASRSWDGLYLQVIKPLSRRGLQFIFHLGDITDKQVFEVDEILDIIGDYSCRGNVTLILDNVEADRLWSRLNGRDALTHTSGQGAPAPGRRYGSLFKTMRIVSLVVLFPSLAVHFSRAGLFDIGKHSPSGAHSIVADRRSFSIGYQLGLLLGLDIPFCTALGLALSDNYPGPGSSGSRSSILLEYINDWLTGYDK